jgi:glycosyltransferase involved in cell wall biosynthesis
MLFPFELIDAILCDFLIIFYRGNIAISVKFEKWIKRFNKKTIRIPILVNRIYVEKPSCIEKKSFKILYTGSLSNRKDSLDVLLRSIQILKEGYKRTNFFVEIYGEGKEQSKMLLQKEIETQRINDYVSYKGNLPLEEIKVRQAECDLLILLRSPNLQNSFGFSTKLAEYLSSGTMVLCTAVSDNGMFVIHGDNGFIVDKNDPQNVASAINEIMTLPFERRQMMAIKAFETVQNNFLPENYSELIGSFLLS